MQRSTSRISGVFFILYFALFPAASAFAVEPASLVIAGHFEISSPERRALTREYALSHYGLDDWRLVEPSMLIIHYTGTDSDRYSLDVFAPVRLSSARGDIESGGDVNVGVHYVILRDGSVWSLLPEDEMGRHAIGYNHRALGIEMTGSSAERITAEQIASCAALAADIASRHPSLRYIVGHHEYMEEGLPHLAEFAELRSDYAPTVKRDPGEEVMSRIRDILARDYSVVR